MTGPRKPLPFAEEHPGLFNAFLASGFSKDRETNIRKESPDAKILGWRRVVQFSFPMKSTLEFQGFSDEVDEFLAKYKATHPGAAGLAHECSMEPANEVLLFELRTRAKTTPAAFKAKHAPLHSLLGALGFREAPAVGKGAAIAYSRREAEAKFHSFHSRNFSKVVEAYARSAGLKPRALTQKNYALPVLRFVVELKH